MDATLGDTVGAQVIVNSKRQKGANASSSLPSRSAKNALKTQASLPPAVVLPNGDFTPATAAANTVSTVAVGASDALEIRPPFTLVADTVTTTTIAPSPLISSPCYTEAASTSTSLGTVSNTSVSRKATAFPPGVAAPFRPGGPSNPLNVSSSSSFASSCLAVPVPAPLFATTTKATGSELHSRRRGYPQGGATVGLEEALKRQEEQVHLERVARRRMEAKEKRRERREVRMAESLGRIATALELLSSKQDTVIALLQRLADRK